MARGATASRNRRNKNDIDVCFEAPSSAILVFQINVVALVSRFVNVVGGNKHCVATRTRNVNVIISFIIPRGISCCSMKEYIVQAHWIGVVLIVVLDGPKRISWRKESAQIKICGYI